MTGHFAGDTSSHEGVPVATVDVLLQVLVHVRCEFQVHLVRELAEAKTRIAGGDLTVIDEVRHNHAVQQELPESHPARVFGEAAERLGAERQQKGAHVEWRECRTEQIAAGKECNDLIKAIGASNPKVHAIINNMKNQSVFGYDCTTAAFKKQHGIPKSHSMPQYMAPVQLSFHKTMTQVTQMALEAHETTPTQGDVIVTAQNIADRFRTFCADLGVHRLPIKNREREVKAIEAQEAKRQRIEGSAALVALSSE